jgi:3-oxoacyl-[acyl-carrier protein] reductase
MENPFDLTGRVALVTGASRGIGAAVARTLAAQGALVAVGHRSGGSAAAEVVASIEAAGGRAVSLAFDVTDTASVDAAVQGLVERAGRLDVLVNNAGISKDALLLRLRDETLDALIDTNLKGAVRCARAALRPMLKQRSGRIVQISSVVAEQGNAGQAAYSATKAALIGFTKSLALEVAGRGITVNAVTPGFIETEMTASLSDDARAAALAHTPLGRLGTPADVAPAVLYFASDAAAWVTGQVLRVNGGMYL